MKLVSTRNGSDAVEASVATIKGIAPDGGLYVPLRFPDIRSLGDTKACSYTDLCARVLRLFFDDITDLHTMIKDAYKKFDDSRIAPVIKTDAGEYVLELWHGPTLAFKDMALSILPRLMTAAMGDGNDIIILVATSGDTGKAALEGFRDVERIKIIVFYPDQGVSDMQKLQMITQEGKNVNVVAIRGNFDDAQNAVKAIFNDKSFTKKVAEKGYDLSSANSINFGRLAPQIAYYIWAYDQLLQSNEIMTGEKINFVVPTGNFGNILAAYYAKKMGLPVNKLICASNKNNVLTDFFRKGEYSLEREFYKTMSPSMDILISSNLERLLFELTGRDAVAVADMMIKLKEKGGYIIGGDAKAALEADFYADWCDEEETKACIKETYESKGYLLDTHTAVAYGVYNKYKKNDEKKTVIVSTASPYKFPKDVLESLGADVSGLSGFDMVKMLSDMTKTPVPYQIAELKTKKVLHTHVVDKDALRDAVIAVL